MPSVARVGDPTTCGDVMDEGSGNVHANGMSISRKLKDHTAGHCFKPTLISEASPTVFVNNVPMVRVADPIIIHCCGKSCHGGTIANGSPDVFANGGTVSGPAPVKDDFFFIQPGVTEFLAGVSLNDDPQSDDGLAIWPAVKFGSTPTVQQVQRSIDNGYDPNGPDAVVLDSDNTPPGVQAPLPADCADIEEHEGSFPGNFVLSPNFILENVSTNTALSKYPVINQVGLTIKDIVCNFRYLCVNILEPMQTLYGSFLITSGFRFAGNGAKNSQHYKGQGIDIQFPGFTSQQYWDRSIEIKNNVTYDQMILEYGGINPWFHLSFSKTSLRQQVLTRTRPGKYVTGLTRVAY